MIKKYLTHSNISLQKCEEMWDLTGKFPVPKWELLCPCCKTKDAAVIRQISFHLRDDSPTKYRCRVQFKCTNCSHVYQFGIVVSKEMYDKHDYIKFYSYNALKDFVNGK